MKASARRIKRTQARQENGDFSALVSGRPLDTEYRRLVKAALKSRRQHEKAQLG